MCWTPPISINTLFVFNFNCPSPGYRIPEHVIEKDIILTVRPVICEGCHFTHILITLTCPYHFTKRGGGGEGGRGVGTYILMFLWETRKVGDHVFLCSGYQFGLFLRLLLYQILELYRHWCCLFFIFYVTR